MKFNKPIKLTVELVPKSCWFSNVRDHVSSSQWNIIKKHTFNLAHNRCEICNGVGPKWPVECHEVWHYDDQLKIQTLVRTIALCPSCHQVKHIGLASILGKLDIAKRHFVKINQCSNAFADDYIRNSFNLFEIRSKSSWILDISWIEKVFNITINTKR